MSGSNCSGPCLLCYKTTDNCLHNSILQDQSSSNSENSAVKDNKLLALQTNTILILRRILEVPKNICASLIETRGNPSEWFPCCFICTDLIEKALTIYKILIDHERRFQRIQNEIKEIIETSKSFDYDNAGRVFSQNDIGQSALGNKNYMFFSKTVDEIRSFIFTDLPYRPQFCDYFNLHHLDLDHAAKLKDKETIVKVEAAYSDSDHFDENESCNMEYSDNLSMSNESYPGEERTDMDNTVDIKPQILEDNFTTKRICKRTYKSIKYYDPGNCSFSLSEQVATDVGFESYVAQSHQNLSEDVGNMKPNKIHKCIQCKKTYRLRKFLTFHFGCRHMTASSKSCRNCHQDFITHEDYKTHCEEQHPEMFPTNKIKDRYDLNKLKQRPWKCDLCELRFKKPESLHDHLNMHTGDKPHKCQTCGKKFSLTSNLNKHMKDHSKELQFSCDLCQNRFETITELEKHQIFHANGDRHKCSVCDKTFKQTKTLKYHERLHLEISQRKFDCSECGKIFPHAASLNEHLKIHTGEKPYECEFCLKRFRLNNNWQRHRRTHAVEKPHICSTCGKGFASPGMLKGHAKSHSTERPHSCQICGKTYKTVSTFNFHMKSHTGKKPHLCSICGARFAEPNQLKTHALVHTGEKPYPCQFCGKAFARRSNTTDHEKACKKRNTS